MLDGAGNVDAPLREPAEQIDEQEGEAARVVSRAEAPTRDQPHRAERERRPVCHALYLVYPWPVRLPPAPVSLRAHKRLPASCCSGGRAPPATCRGAARAIRTAC